MMRLIFKAWLLLATASVLSVQAKWLNTLDVEQLESKGYAQRLSNPRADDNSEGNYRLPNNTAPLNYEVELTTQVHNGDRAFDGIVKIDLEVLEDTRTIVLHSRQTDTKKATIKSQSSADIELVWEYEDKREFLSFTPNDATTNFTKGSNWQLTIEYNGTLRADNGGFYLSSYKDDDNVEHYLATTQFESTNARHAFPCYDEPALRATFEITIKHDPSYNAISNMPVNAEKSSSGVTAFNKTVKMPSYLVAFIVSDFEYTKGELNNLPQRVFTRKGTQVDQSWALTAGLLVESSLSGYFNVPFALPKLDQAAIPDFAAGAMENWGLATYRQEYLLWNKENSTTNSKTQIANIIGHEYAHMWFGDAVSIKWWTYLWLKEGFATIFSYESDDIAYPEWNIYQYYHVSSFTGSLINDASAGATPMTHYVQTPDEISGRYNTFSYDKPGAVLYMFKNAWTDAVFRLGLHKYLTDHQFNSCDEWDLFESLQKAADELDHKLPTTVANIFSSWSQQGGFPLLTVSRNYEGGTFTVSQKRYSDDKDEVNTKTWYVPINYVVQSNPDFRDTTATHWLLNETELSVSDVGLKSDEYLLLNKQSSSYYRILYDDRNYELITLGLLDGNFNIHVRNRAQLMHDAYRFVATQRLGHDKLFYLMTYLRREDQYAPWSIANSIFNVYDQYLRGDTEYNQFRNYVIELVEGMFEKVGVNERPGEHYLSNYLRTTLISLACQVGSEKCYDLSHTKLKSFFNEGIRIEPTLRTQIYCAGLRRSENEVYDKVYDALNSSTVSSDRSMYISSLGCSQTASQVKKFIESSIDTSNSLSSSERITLLRAAYSRGEVGLTTSLEFLETNWEAYGKLESAGTPKPLDAELRNMAAYVVSESQKTRLNALVQKVSGSELVNDDLSTRVDSTTQQNFDWLELHRNPVVNWIASYRTSGGSAMTTSITTLLVTLVLLYCTFF